MMSELVFDPVEHRYWIGSTELPSVTTVLAGSGVVDTRAYANTAGRAAASRGTMVHAACQYFDEGDLDFDTVAENLVPYVDAWRSYVTEANPEMLLIEERVHSGKWGFAGTLDRLVNVGGKLTVLDIKTGAVVRQTGLQLAAYAMALEEMSGYKVEQRIAVHLRRSGAYSVELYDDESERAVFLAALAVYRWKKRGER
jgi:CRISPR/Cas system-associated exonuclease Cas4 (RecB family)